MNNYLSKTGAWCAFILASIIGIEQAKCLSVYSESKPKISFAGLERVKVTQSQLEKFSSRLSAFSYTLYLTHYPLISLLDNWGFTKNTKIELLSISYYLLAVLISLIIAYLIYLISEKQTNLVKNLIKERFGIWKRMSRNNAKKY